MLVVGPEHERTLADDGWSKTDLRRALHETIRRPYRELLPDDDHGEGTNLRYGKTMPGPDALNPKFPSIKEIHVVVAGGSAGRFPSPSPVGWAPRTAHDPSPGSSNSVDRASGFV